MEGRATSEQAIVKRRRSPPERPRTAMPVGSMPPTAVSAARARPIVSSTASMRSSRALGGVPRSARSLAWKRSVSRAVIVGTKTSSCAT